MTYDPSYWFEREQFIASRREFIHEELDKMDADDQVRDLFDRLLDTYEYIVELYRDYEECFDEERKQKKWRKFVKRKRLYRNAIKQLKQIVEDAANEQRK